VEEKNESSCTETTVGFGECKRKGSKSYWL